METLFPYANVVAGILVLVVAFLFHFCGQLFSIVNWDAASSLGLQDKHAPKAYYPYEHGTAVADVAVGWVYGVAGVGLLLDADWGYRLAWIPGAILIYYSISAWRWEVDRRKAGHGLWTDRFRLAWCGANFLTGALALALAWVGQVPA